MKPEINSYEEYDKEYDKRKEDVDKLLKKVESKREKLTEWSIKTVIDLAERGIYRNLKFKH